MCIVSSLNTHRIQAGYSCNLRQKRRQFSMNYAKIRPELHREEVLFFNKENINA